MSQFKSSTLRLPRLAACAAVLTLLGCAGPHTPLAPGEPGTAPSSEASTTSPAALAPTPPPTPTPPPGLLVPLYMRPEQEAWKRLVALKARHPALPVVAIVNPNNGASWGVEQAYVDGIAKLRAAGITVVGYVFTSYGGRAASSVKREVTRWHDEYPDVEGIFFDEMATALETLPFYQQAAGEVRALGYGLLIGNFGTRAAAAMRGTVDVAVTYEAAGWPTDAKGGDTTRDREAALVYHLTTFEPAAASLIAGQYRYLYATDDTPPDPWNTLGRFTESLADTLAAR